MPTKLFVSGKNWKLSLAELAAYLNARNANFKINFYSKEFFKIKIDEKTAPAIDDLGGTIKIGEAMVQIPTLLIKQALFEKDKQAEIRIIEAIFSSGLVDGVAEAAGKAFFGVSVYCADRNLSPHSRLIQRFFGSLMKDELAERGKKSKFMGFSRDRKQPQLSHVEVLKKKLLETKGDVLVCISAQETWLGVTVAVHNPFEFQKRDIYKPNQRRIFAMPPRVARIMVNLSACTPGKVLLDPFCGVGTILQEALLEQAKVIGVDNNAWCVKAANENLDWLTKEYGLQGTDFRVVQGDVSKLAQKIGQETVDCIVTEPDLGPALRQVPTGPYAQRIIQKLEPLYFEFVEQAFKVLKEGGRLVVVTPYIVTRSGQAVTMRIYDKCESLGFKENSPFSKEIFSSSEKGVDSLTDLSSLIEVDERHKIGREIHIYQK